MKQLKPLTADEMRDFAYFIRFCDGIHDTGKRSRPMLCGSGLGRAFLGDAFGADNKRGRLVMEKARRRGWAENNNGRWSATEAGRIAAGVQEERDEI